MNEDEIRQKAIEFARANKNSIAKELTSTFIYAPDPSPISIFMAGSPGAGKTEYSKSIIEILEQSRNRKILRMDGDELRSRMPGYIGRNSSLFQGAVSIILDRMHDLALDHKQTFLLDGTFSRYEKAAENIRRSLARKRTVFVLYIYQQPEVAWKFTQARETVEGRNIPKEAFIEQFLSAKNTVERIRANFSDEVAVFLVKKNFETSGVDYVVEIEPVGLSIDSYLKERYTREDLEQIL